MISSVVAAFLIAIPVTINARLKELETDAILASATSIAGDLDAAMRLEEEEAPLCRVACFNGHHSMLAPGGGVGFKDGSWAQGYIPGHHDGYMCPCFEGFVTVVDASTKIHFNTQPVCGLMVFMLRDGKQVAIHQNLAFDGDVNHTTLQDLGTTAQQGLLAGLHEAGLSPRNKVIKVGFGGHIRHSGQPAGHEHQDRNWGPDLNSLMILAQRPPHQRGDFVHAMSELVKRVPGCEAGTYELGGVTKHAISPCIMLIRRLDESGKLRNEAQGGHEMRVEFQPDDQLLRVAAAAPTRASVWDSTSHHWFNRDETRSWAMGGLMSSDHLNHISDVICPATEARFKQHINSIQGNEGQMAEAEAHLGYDMSVLVERGNA